MLCLRILGDLVCWLVFEWLANVSILFGGIFGVMFNGVVWIYGVLYISCLICLLMCAYHILKTL